MSGLRALLGARRIHLVDVGARAGTHRRWTRFAELLDVTGFEPAADECAALNAAAPPRHRYLPYALSDRAAVQTFHVCRQAGYSGLYPPNRPFLAPFADAIRSGMHVERTVPITTTTLDTIHAATPIRADCLKIDVQGAELDILRGAERVLANTKIVELEVEFNPQYEGQPLFSEVDAYMRSQGFLLRGLRRTAWRWQSDHGLSNTTRGGQIMHGDALYYHAGLLEAERTVPAELAVWLVLLSAYRQDDAVEWLLADRSDRDTIREQLREDGGGSWRVILARLLTAGLHHRDARALVDACRRPRAIDWHDPDFV